MLNADELACIRARAKYAARFTTTDVLRQRDVLIRTDIPALLYHIADLENAISAAHKSLCQMDVDEESDIACYRDEAIELLKGATNG